MTDQPAETQRGRRCHDFYPAADRAATIPAVYAIEETGGGQGAAPDYFAGGCDWWIADGTVEHSRSGNGARPAITRRE
jgi:hypothetical protein